MSFLYFKESESLWDMVILYLARKIWQLEIIDNSHNER